MSLQRISQEKFWTYVVKEGRDLSCRINMGFARHEAIDFFNNIGCHIDYYYDPQHNAVVYQPYMPKRVEE